VRLHALKIYIVWLQFEEEARKTLSAGRGLPVADLRLLGGLQSQRGVELMLNKQSAKNVKQVDTVSDRLLIVRLK